MRASKVIFYLLPLSVVCRQTGAQTTGYQWTNLAGLPGGAGNPDATGSAARFYDPGGLCYDASGNVLVADTVNHAIRKVAAAGVVTTFAGLTQNAGQTTNATAAAARFWNSRGVVIDSQGNLFAADQSNSLIRKITPARLVTGFAGGSQLTGPTDGAGSVARCNNPQCLCIDASDNLYIADANDHLIRKVWPKAGLGRVRADVHRAVQRRPHPMVQQQRYPPPP